MRGYLILFFAATTLFRTSISGVIQTTSSTATQVTQSINDKSCKHPADIVFLIDGSDSINDGDFVRLKTYVANIIYNFEIGHDAVRVGSIVYSTAVGDRIGLLPQKNKLLLMALVKILDHPKFGTDTAAGIRAARDMISQQGRPNSSQIIVVITDGRSTSPTKTIAEANLAKADGISVIAIGVGESIFSEELNQIATSSKYVSQMADFRSLAKTVTIMKDLICTLITPATLKMSPTKSTQMTITASVSTQTTLTTTTLPVTLTKTTQKTPTARVCNSPADIVFVIDGSDSINDADFIRLKRFVADLIDHMEIGPSTMNVGVIVYSTLIEEKIGLFPLKSKSTLKTLVNNLAHPKFGTDTAAGIQAARDMIRRQGRENGQDIIVVITDGRSTNPRNTINQASLAKTSGITVVTIGVGKNIFSSELRQISTSSKYVLKVADFRALAQTVTIIRDLICTSIKTKTTTTATI